MTAASAAWNRAHPEAGRAASMRYYHKNRDKVRAWQREGNARRRREMVTFLTTYKLLSGCVDCGYRDNPDALQFDHVKDKKQLVAKAGSVKARLPELRKCEVRCANCHAIVTAERRRDVA